MLRLSCLNPVKRFTSSPITNPTGNYLSTQPNCTSPRKARRVKFSILISTRARKTSPSCFFFRHSNQGVRIVLVVIKIISHTAFLAPHISIVVLNLRSPSLPPTCIDVSLTEQQFLDCMESSSCCSFQVHTIRFRV